MYSVVLMMALGNGSSLPTVQGAGRPEVAPYATHTHMAHRGRRGCHGCSGCYGCYGCSGCYGGWGCYGGYSGCCGGYSGGYFGGRAGYGAYYGGFYSGMTSVNGLAEAPATIVVNLPSNAKLMVDDQPTQSQSARRVFTSPPIAAGQRFHYTLKAEVESNGKPTSVTKEVLVEAGHETQVTFDFAKTMVTRR